MKIETLQNAFQALVETFDTDIAMFLFHYRRQNNTELYQCLRKSSDTINAISNFSSMFFNLAPIINQSEWIL